MLKKDLKKIDKIIEEIVELLNIDEFLELIEDEEETDCINADNNKLLYNILDKVEKDYKEHKSEIKKIRTCIEDLDNGKYMGKGRDLTYADLKKILLKLKRLLKNHLKHDNTYSFDKYTQRDKKIYAIGKEPDKTKDKLICNLSFDSLSINYDPLNLFPPTFNIKYYHGIMKELILIENATEKELTKELENSLCFLDNKKIPDVIKHLIIYSDIKGDLNVTKNMKKKGFYILKDKVVENSEIKNLDYDKEKLKKALSLLNEILDNREEQADHDAAVYRFMLHSPFHWCIKQLGKHNYNLKYYELYGKRGANKTGAVKIGQWFYFENPTFEEDKINTVPAFVRKVQEDTFPKLCDESKDLLEQKKFPQVLKSTITGKYSYSAVDNETGDNKSYLALSTPIFTHNEPHIIDDGNIRRSMSLYYDESYIIKEEEVKSFVKDYNPENKDSKFKIFNHIGYAFKEKIISLIEANDNRLSDIESLTIKLLKEIAEDVGVELNQYLLKKAVRSTGLDENPTEKLKNGLRELLRKNIKINYNADSYNSNDLEKGAYTGAFSWLFKQKTKDGFIIKQSTFVKECAEITGHIWTLQEILEALNLVEKGTKIKIDDYRVNGHNEYGFRICTNHLANKIFSISLEDEEELTNFSVGGDEI